MELIQHFIAEILVTVTALLVLFVDLTLARRQPLSMRHGISASLAVVGCLAAALWLGFAGPANSWSQDGLALSRQGQFLKVITVLLCAAAAVLAVQTQVKNHVGEYYSLLLLATLGAMLLLSATEMLVFFVSLELMSLSLYVLTAFNKDRIFSAEAALKYFLIGSVSSAILLFGLSFMYGLLNTTQLSAIRFADTHSPLFWVAVVMIFAGLAFKLAAAPFHLWAPDVYEAGCSSTSAFIASASKVASFYVAAIVMGIPLVQLADTIDQSAHWQILMVIISIASMTIGNLAALAQKSVKRLLAYSAVAHAGYMLLAFVFINPDSARALFFYVVTYAVATMGAFAVVSAVSEKTQDDSRSAFNGLSQTSPFLSFCLLIFMLSLAGIPPLAGFTGKFFIFVSLFKSGSLLSVCLLAYAMTMSVISLYYYLKVLKAAYVEKAATDHAPIAVPLPLGITLFLLMATVLALGCLPSLLLARF